MKQSIIIAALFTGCTGDIWAQEETTTAPSKPLSISGYAEAYYQYDANNPLSNARPGFVYSHNRNNEVSLNLAYLKASYSTAKTRANLALAAGSYMNANYAAEPGVLKNIYEGNVGVKITKKYDLWIDAGIFPSHLGFESAVGKDNWALTRSLFADNSPYFETGAKISYTSPNAKWLVSGLILNGWQRIQRAEGNSTPAFGHQITYKPYAKLTLNSGSFIGNDKADSIRQMRYFHNFYALYQASEKMGITAGFDIGAEQKEKGSRSYNTWFTTVLIVKYNATDKFSLTARGEYYQDKAGVLIATGTQNGFKTFGYSLNADYAIMPNLVWRAEIKNLNSKDAVFLNRNEAFTSNSCSVITALALSF
ncbi:MAG: porin [Sphingobacteriales bacterium]|nr:MAG: porin [Sphingobacteriales bacterium]